MNAAERSASRSAGWKSLILRRRKGRKSGSKDTCFSCDEMKPNGSASEIAQTARAATEHSLLTVEEVAALLKVPPSWVYDRTRRRASDRIPGFRLGKYWRFREADVLAWLERQRENEA